MALDTTGTLAREEPEHQRTLERSPVHELVTAAASAHRSGRGSFQVLHTLDDTARHVMIIDMNGKAHRMFGFIAGAGVTYLAGRPGWECLTAGVIAAVPAGGRTFSPDMDQTGVYRFFMPKRLEGHRYVTHMWRWPIIALTASFAVYTFMHQPWWILPIVAWLIGWTSHLVADGVFGRRDDWVVHSDGWIAKRFQYIVFPAGMIVLTALSLARLAG